MERRIFLVLSVFFFVFFISSIAVGEMQSTNYTIPTFAFSGGSGTMGSASFEADGTLNQSSPLMDPADPPYSMNYELYPGFWYVITALQSTCPGDFDGDKDVDGADLADYLFDSRGLGVNVFADDFGKNNCP